MKYGTPLTNPLCSIQGMRLMECDKFHLPCIICVFLMLVLNEGVSLWASCHCVGINNSCYPTLETNKEQHHGSTLPMSLTTRTFLIFPYLENTSFRVSAVAQDLNNLVRSPQIQIMEQHYRKITPSVVAWLRWATISVASGSPLAFVLGISVGNVGR